MQALYHRNGRKSQKLEQEDKLGKLIGQVWLVFFLAWSTPVWAYPAMIRNQGTAKDRVLPYSVIKPIIGAWAE